MHKCGPCRQAVSVCPFVCVSTTFVDSVKTNKHIFKMFLLSGSHAILVFPYQTSWWYSDGDPPQRARQMQGWVGRNCDSQPISGFIVCCQHYQHCAAGPWQVVTLIAGSMRQSLLIAEDNDEMFMTGTLNIMPKTAEQHLIGRNDKSFAYVTNNNRLCSTCCTIVATVTTERHEASHGLFVTAELLVVFTPVYMQYVCMVSKEVISW